MPPTVSGHERGDGSDLGVEACLSAGCGVFPGVDGDSVHRTSLKGWVAREETSTG